MKAAHATRVMLGARKRGGGCCWSRETRVSHRVLVRVVLGTYRHSDNHSACRIESEPGGWRSLREQLKLKSCRHLYLRRFVETLFRHPPSQNEAWRAVGRNDCREDAGAGQIGLLFGFYFFKLIRL